jgi:hypothetical protein
MIPKRLTADSNPFFPSVTYTKRSTRFQTRGPRRAAQAGQNEYPADKVSKLQVH